MFAIGRQGLQTGDVSERRFIFGAGMAIRKSVWCELMAKGYRSFLSDRQGVLLSSGGDSEICAWHLREGYKLFYDENLRLRHYVETGRLDMRYLRRLKSSMAEANMVLRVYHSLLDREPTSDSPRDKLKGIPLILSGLLAYPFSRKTALRKLVKAQIAFGTSVSLIPRLHEIISYYSCISPLKHNDLPKPTPHMIEPKPEPEP
jgi:hypothetical protein